MFNSFISWGKAAIEGMIPGCDFTKIRSTLLLCPGEILTIPDVSRV